MPFSVHGDPLAVKLDPTVADRILRSESGPVVRDLMVRGEKVKNRAKQLVGVSTPDPWGRPAHPGVLRDSIVKRLVRIGGDPAVVVGVFDGPAIAYARFHHEGTQPHIIVPVRKQWLVFWAGGHVVKTGRVRHPGTRPNRFLTNAMREAGGN